MPIISSTGTVEVEGTEVEETKSTFKLEGDTKDVSQKEEEEEEEGGKDEIKSKEKAASESDNKEKDDKPPLEDDAKKDTAPKESDKSEEIDLEDIVRSLLDTVEQLPQVQPEEQPPQGSVIEYIFHFLYGFLFQSPGQDRAKVIPVKEFGEHVQRMHKEKNSLFEMEYNVSYKHKCSRTPSMPLVS